MTNGTNPDVSINGKLIAQYIIVKTQDQLQTSSKRITVALLQQLRSSWSITRSSQLPVEAKKMKATPVRIK